jgi:hypothetical protein
MPVKAPCTDESRAFSTREVRGCRAGWTEMTVLRSARACITGCQRVQRRARAARDSQRLWPNLQASARAAAPPFTEYAADARAEARKPRQELTLAFCRRQGLFAPTAGGRAAGVLSAAAKGPTRSFPGRLLEWAIPLRFKAIWCPVPDVHSPVEPDTAGATTGRTLAAYYRTADQQFLGARRFPRAVDLHKVMAQRASSPHVLN